MLKWAGCQQAAFAGRPVYWKKEARLMSDLSALFSGARFQSTIQSYCDQNGWIIADINDRRAILRFNMESGRSQSLFIIRYDSTLEFSVPSMAAFPDENAVPHYFSTLLLKRNCEMKIGFWCIEEIGGQHVFSHMHNAEIRLMDSSYFASVVRALLTECDDFETIFEDIIK